MLLLPSALGAVEPPRVLLHDTTEWVYPPDIKAHLLLFFDEGKTISPREINERKDLPWRPVQERTQPAGDYYLWMKVTFHNTGQEARHDYIGLSDILRNMEAYVFKGDLLIDQVDSKAMHSLPGFFWTMPFSLQPGEEQTIYFRGKYSYPESEEKVAAIVLAPSQTIVFSRVAVHADQYLYAGLMLGLILISMFLFLMFREGSFVYFSIMTVGFIYYFGALKYLEGWISARDMALYNIALYNLALILIIVGGTGFVYKYLGLNLRSSRRCRIFILATASYLPFVGYATIFTKPVPYLDLFLGVTGLFWVTMILVVTWGEVRKKTPGARTLLFSLLLLCVFGVVQVVAIAFFDRNLSFSWLFQLGTIIFSSIVFVGLYDKVSMIRNRSEKLATQQNFTNRFFTNISHEFRTPLTLMLGPVQQLLDENPEPAAEKLLKIVQRNARRQLDLVNEIMELSRLQATQLLLHAQAMDVIPLLRRITHGYDSLAERRDIRLSFHADAEVLVLKVEAGKLETICHNLLSNAFRFTPHGGEISLSVTVQEQQAVIRVRDNGRGIAPAALPKVFNRFYFDEEHKQSATLSSGVGLDLTRELVLLHDGEIRVESKPGVATVFTISLPYEPGLEAEVEAPVISDDLTPETQLVDAEESQETAVLIAAPEVKDAPLIVIVEDNTDMRTYLAGCLTSTYRVRLAKNGREGLALIRELTPDLVISDVMMPEMDGMEMCHALKSELAISHIPVILLTARSAAEDRLEGLDTGADDYLTKPFDAEELLARSRNLIASRRLLRERFATSVTLKPEEVATTSVDQEFLQSALRIVEENMDNVSLSVDDLAQELFISKTGLNRKFRALLDQSTNEFIRSIRLERAVDLLENSDFTVAQIAMETGFNSTSYFIRRFRDKFGTTPGDFRKRGATDPVGVDPE